jgi:peptidoglycan/LPS O-acetylase OafA/YrhL
MAVLDRYVPALDGLRALSILLVVFAHFGIQPSPGLFGVTIFFFISGYLITGQILGEIDRTGRLDLGMFYWRRALRLYPALLAMVVFGGLAFVAVGGMITATDVAAALFYFANIHEIAGGFDSGLLRASHPYSVLWSLAVEEHYYLLFPLIAALFAVRRLRLAGALVAIIAAVTLWRFHVAGTGLADSIPLRVEHGTDTRVDSILYGALLSVLLASRWRAATLRLVANPTAAVVGLALLLLSLTIRDPWFRHTWRFTVQGVGLFLSVGALLHGPSLAAARWVASTRTALLLGRWSYSLYLWHWIVLSLAVALLPVTLAKPLIETGRPPIWWLASVFLPLLGVSLALSAASYYGVERPMLRVRRAFGSHAIADEALSATRHTDDQSPRRETTAWRSKVRVR